MTPTPSSTDTFEEISVVTDVSIAVPNAPATAVPVAALEILKYVEVAAVITALDILKAVVDKPDIETV
jgi:hypothetical protein